MMRRGVLCLWLLAVPIVGPAAQGAVGSEVCPPTLSVSDAAVAHEPWIGWSRNVKIEHALVGVTFSDGPPADQVFITERRATSSVKGKTEVYDFRPKSFGVIWMSCSYESSASGVTRPTSLKGATCSVFYPRDKGGGPRLTCR